MKKTLILVVIALEAISALTTSCDENSAIFGEKESKSTKGTKSPILFTMTANQSMDFISKLTQTDEVSMKMVLGEDGKYDIYRERRVLTSDTKKVSAFSHTIPER
jgi:hypothetical protein